MTSTELAKEITATMALRLPGTVGKIANKMRYISAKAPELTRGGIVRPMPHLALDNVRAAGIASVSRHFAAFGGVLYGAAALRCDVTVAGNRVIDTYQDSRIDVNDMNYLETKKRLAWKEYALVYTLLQELFAETNPPDIVLLDIPLLVPRAQQSGALESEDLLQEWEDLMAAMTSFWERNLQRVFPQDRQGPLLVSLSTRYTGAILHGIREKGVMASPEEIDPQAAALVSQDWQRLREVGIMRVLEGLLRAEKRTAAYYYDALGQDALRAEPKVVSGYGLLGLHLRVGLRTPIWQLETLGNRGDGMWSEEDLDRLSGLVAYLTLHDNRRSLPLPLWYAKKLVRMPKSVLASYYRETRRMLADGSVDAAWLEGMEAMEGSQVEEGEEL